VSFDYIIVGAGSAGCTLANRLSEDPTRSVLLIEAGELDGGLWSRIPLGVGKILNDDRRIWRVQTEASPHTANVPRDWVSGKCVGGSSAVNGLVVVRGHPERYDQWAAQGGTGWSYADCLPYFKRLESWQGAAGASRGSAGPIGVMPAEPEPISDRFLAACEAMGFPRVDDYNARPGIGASYLQLSTRGGLRSDVGTAYLKPILARANLTVMRGALAQRVVIDGGRAVSVVATVAGRETVVDARREVIVACGAVRSPQLLELSGIGQPQVLEAHGIPVMSVSPHVGEHLQDHIMVRVCYRTGEPGTVNAMLGRPWRLVGEAARFALARRGMFSSATLKSTLYAPSDPARTTPDLRIQIALVSATDRIPKSLNEGLDPGSAFQIGVYGLYPTSAGASHVQSRTPSTAPRVQPNYLASDEDRRVLLAGLNLVRALADTAPLRAIIEEEIRPGMNARTPEQLLDYATRTGQTCWHPIGTCRMGAPGESVVDPACRVHGVRGLRVIDAAVFPLLTSSNTNIPTIMLAEKMADALRREAAA